ncbi:MAG TPA: tRNA 2-thiouridine(34) synthase MnmA [Candidatus Paceibacterota bacterium]|nr:tRNA 2-thiouridine(34) synthase MnmA [Candidatus Paceibacterota bacterium]
MNLTGKRIFVGLSGGVDSAVSAALLQRAGAEVTGVFIKGWYPPGMPCSWAKDRKDAMRVAARLHIPFVTLDASKEYKQGVMDYLVREYGEGRTPNPDIMCNKEVKFGAFYAYAREKKADYIATGHYARKEDGRIARGMDEDKDQSYFLWAISKEALAHTLFPVGKYKKPEVRKLAKDFRLPVAAKRDSQGICFLGNISVDDFLAQEFGEAPGKAYDTEGNDVGVHNGVLLHTIGERVSLTNAAPGPWYVVRKRVRENELVVSKDRLAQDAVTSITLSQTNWFTDIPKGEVEAQYRYHGPKVTGKILGNTFIPSAPLPEAVAEGQSLVIYDDNRVIGGGIIG